MIKSKLGRFIDNLSIFALIFIILFVFVKSIIASNIITLAISFVISFLTFKLILYFQNRNLRKLSIKNNEKQYIIDCNFALRKLSESSQKTFFKNLLSSKKIVSSPHGLIVENKILLLNALNQDIIYPETIYISYSKAKNMKKYKVEEICLICNKISEEAKNLLSNFTDLKFTIFTPIETYALMKKYTYFPNLPPKPIKEKPNIFKENFIKQKGKNFIKCGIILYVFSLLVPFTKYYLISASILTILGISCLLFGKRETIVEPLSKQILLNA